jgi:Domain of unknown function (DUF6458)
MKTATGLTLIAIGAVLAFAVNGHPWFLNLQIVGWIIMVIGVIGLVIPRSGYGWLRRQVVTRRGPDGRQVVSVQQKRTPPYIMLNPAAAAEPEIVSESAPIPGVPEDAEPSDWVVDDTAKVETTRAAVPKEETDVETVEEYFRE